MHIIVDIRGQSSYSTSATEYGIRWAELWQAHHPLDHITFLIHEFQEKKDSNYKVVRSSSYFFPQKLIPSGSNEVYRLISFSSFGVYTSALPSLTHIWDNADWLYPTKENEGYIQRKLFEYKKRALLHKSHTIIVPNIATGNELVELWQTPEEKIEIIPYIHLRKEPEIVPIGSVLNIHEPFFLYDAGYHGGINIVGLLKSFEQYRHQLQGKNILVLHGFIGSELSNITQIIRSFDLTQSVKIAGALPLKEKHTLYAHAKGWIAPGPYYAGGPNIELACTYEIPLLLADIKSLDDYHGIKIHPNHGEQLPQALKKLETATFIPHHSFEEFLFIKAYEKCLMKGYENKFDKL